MDNPESLDEFLKEQLKDSEFRREYGALQAEFERERAEIEEKLEIDSPEANSDES